VEFGRLDSILWEQLGERQVDVVLLLVLLVVLARVNALGSSVRVSLEEFLSCLGQTDERCSCRQTSPSSGFASGRSVPLAIGSMDVG
jgi:hypothetical protein